MLAVYLFNVLNAAWPSKKGSEWVMVEFRSINIKILCSSFSAAYHTPTMTEKFVPHSTSQQNYHNSITFLEKRAKKHGEEIKADVLREQYRVIPRRQSFLYATELEREHQKNRVALAMTPEQSTLIQQQELEVDNGCQQLLVLLKKLNLQHRYKNFRRHGITYETAKTLTARDFTKLGKMTNPEALRLANTLSYASAVQKSYEGVADREKRKYNYGTPLLFKDDPDARVNRLSPSSTGKHQRRLSALGRDLLDVFDQQLQ